VIDLRRIESRSAGRKMIAPPFDFRSACSTMPG
jgi:hypothetical protein